MSMEVRESCFSNQSRPESHRPNPLRPKRYHSTHGSSLHRQQVATGSERTSLTKEDEQKILSPNVNLGEKLLYDTFNSTWWRQEEVKTDDFWEEVRAMCASTLCLYAIIYHGIPVFTCPDICRWVISKTSTIKRGNTVILY